MFNIKADNKKNALDISQRENHFAESDIFNVFPLEDENFVPSSPLAKKQRLEEDDFKILSTQTLESSVAALKNRESELCNTSIR